MSTKKVSVFLLVMLLIASAVPVAGAAPSAGGPSTGSGDLTPEPMLFDQNTDLVARRTTTPITIDGVADAQWGPARALKAFATGPSGNFNPDLKATYDDTWFYLIVTWDELQANPRLPRDSNYDREPWNLTSNATPGTWGADPWGEDRISFIWEDADHLVAPFGSQGCDGVCHNQLEMYTLNPGELLDVWVWSAAVTNVNGYADDGYLTNNNSVAFDPLRMHVTKSDIDWDTGDDGWRVNKDIDGGGHRPTYIWKDGVVPANRSFLMESEAQQVDWSSFDISTLPTGYRVPSHLIKSPSGDRADIEASGVWDGKNWTVEVKRKLVTGSSKDVPFEHTNTPYYFSIAVTDNMTQENHSKAPKAYKLWLAEPELPDLAGYNISLVNAPYTVNADVLVNVFFENRGWADSAATSAAMYWDEETTPHGYIDIAAIPWSNNLRPSYEAVWDSTGLSPGLHKLKVVADPNGTVTEIDETNNVLVRDVVLYAELLPDLTIAGLSLDPVAVPRGTSPTINVSVRNAGQLDATGVDVIAYLDNPSTPLASDTVSVTKGQAREVSLSWPLVSLPLGSYVLNVSVDPDDTIREANETNNTLSLPFTVVQRTLADLVILSLTPDAGTVSQGEETGATVVIKNQGDAAAPATLEVALYLDEAFTHGLSGQIGTATIGAPLAAGSTWSPVIGWTVPLDAELGPHFLRAHVNWNEGVTESDASNNNATFDDLIVVPKPKADLRVASYDPAALAAKLETVLYVNITVLNDGGIASQPTTLDVLDATNNRTLDTLLVPSIAALGTAVVEFQWGVTGVPVGTLELAFIIDPDDMIDEEDELNNALSADLDVQAADVSDLAIMGVAFAPAEPRVGDAVTITITLRNNGTRGSLPTTLEVKLGNNRIGEKAVGAIAVGAQSTVEVAWSAVDITTPMRYSLLVTVDPSGINRETVLANNEALAHVTFAKAPAAVLGNLTIASSSSKVKDGKEVTITVTLRNTGDAADTVRLVLKDGTTEVGSRQGVVIAANGSKTETFVVKLTGRGEHTLTVTVYKGTTPVQGLEESATVQVEKADDGPGFGLAAAALALGAVVVAIALVSGRRRRR